MKKKLIVIRGPSGVGKSTISKLLSTELQKKNKKVCLISIDLTLAKMFPNPREAPKDSRELMQLNTETLIDNFLSKGYIVITEGQFHRTHNKIKSLDRLIKIGYKHKAKTIVVELTSDINTILKRIKIRSKKNSKHDNNLEHAKKRYKRFSKTTHKDSIQIDTRNKIPEKIVEEIIPRI
ncbi:MAG: ATP-binding protein [Candidatus Pacearchaeota archaeon]|nr:ATP-binding protein [Candidatus Pacearchaeota archaeon]